MGSPGLVVLLSKHINDLACPVNPGSSRCFVSFEMARTVCILQMHAVPFFHLAFQCLIKVLQWTGLYISVVHYPSHKSQNKLTPNIVVSAYQLNFEGNRNVFFFFFSSQGEGWRMQ